jgi:hypothetical protein
MINGRRKHEYTYVLGLPGLLHHVVLHVVTNTFTSEDGSVKSPRNVSNYRQDYKAS